MNPLNRKQALSLLHAVVDNETTEHEKRAFLKFIENHPDIKKEYEEIRLLKHFLARKFTKKKAPVHFRQQILKKIDDIEAQSSGITPGKAAIVQKKERNSNSYYSGINPTIRYISAAAVVLIITLFTIHLLDRIIQSYPGSDDRIIEIIAAKHYMAAGGQYIEPLYKTNSKLEAEHYLLDNYNMDISVPGIEGTELAGLIMVDFINGFETPMLEYVEPDVNEAIYLFVFDVDKVTSIKQLERHKEAVKSCQQEHDFYVAEVDSFHSVSWLWGNTWYTAVSNHNGYDLAAQIEPFNDSSP